MVSADIQARLKEMGLLSPVDPEANSRWKPASRLDTVHGKVGGFLGNRKANAGLLLQGVAELLDRDFELRDGIVTDKAVYSRPAADDIIDDLAERCDFVVTAIAD
ncbi:MAG: hypothetical protein FI717_10765 [SAR202 cluster bacterium]|nr:hypothetical protein [SAR202 cluster bacterium]MQG34772.1 hypothetical protein [SAR202 cluster bacterium]HAA94767.1 hypothetical protein [Dehalococcoidia bacterium]HCP22504.1 hypothetical protein [Dehalococcoidia bacterium]|tara:strand:- start:722 stop:1036 length:315 start_codon:yes stop_codon:yes gene_type:complete